MRQEVKGYNFYYPIIWAVIPLILYSLWLYKAASDTGSVMIAALKHETKKQRLPGGGWGGTETASPSMAVSK